MIMSITLTFHTIKEKEPLEGQEIVWLSKRSALFEGFEPHTAIVEYEWVDEDGTSYTYPPEDGEPWSRNIIFDGEIAAIDDLWADADEIAVALDLVD
jgi:hypothetical protein